MKCLKRYVSLCLLLLCATIIKAQDDFGLWGGIGVEKKITKQLEVGIEGEFRSRNTARTVDRWSGSAGLTYKMCKWLQVSADYTFLYSYEPLEYEKDWDIIPEHWLMRHRCNVALTGKWSIGRFDFSLRERWQYTYRPQQETEKYDHNDGERKDNEVIKGKGKNNLRSRLKIEYDLPKCKFTPYVSCELTHNLHHGFYYEKTRCIVGAEYKLNKKHGFDFYCLYQSLADGEDEPNGLVLGAKYAFKF